jgi:hypothetical protein
MLLIGPRNLLCFQSADQKQISRGVYPESLRYAQGRSQRKGERAPNDRVPDIFPQPVLLEHKPRNQVNRVVVRSVPASPVVIHAEAIKLPIACILTAPLPGPGSPSSLSRREGRA